MIAQSYLETTSFIFKCFWKNLWLIIIKKIKNDFYTRNETLKSSMLYYTNKINKPKKKIKLIIISWIKPKIKPKKKHSKLIIISWIAAK